MDNLLLALEASGIGVQQCWYVAGWISACAVWDWMFLFGHLVWATGFMFLISWRGYWQELIESIVWAHEHTRIANLVYWKARLVGLAHFSIGYVLTYGPFVIVTAPQLQLHR